MKPSFGKPFVPYYVIIQSLIVSNCNFCVETVVLQRSYIVTPSVGCVTVNGTNGEQRPADQTG